MRKRETTWGQIEGKQRDEKEAKEVGKWVEKGDKKGGKEMAKEGVELGAKY